MSALRFSRNPDQGPARIVDALAACALLACAALVLLRTPDTLAMAWCRLAVPFQKTTALREKLFATTSIEQQIDLAGSDNAELSEADVAGWSKFTPRDPSRPATVRVRVEKDRSTLLFYPRVGGADSRVSVLQPGGGWPWPLFRLEGQAGAWTPVSRQYRLCAACLDNSFNQDYTVPLEIVLEGPWAQLWTRDGKLFF